MSRREVEGEYDVKRGRKEEKKVNLYRQTKIPEHLTRMGLLGLIRRTEIQGLEVM